MRTAATARAATSAGARVAAAPSAPCRRAPANRCLSLTLNRASGRPGPARARAAPDSPPPPPPAADGDEDLWIERELRRRKRKRETAGPKVVAPAVARATGAAPATPTDGLEAGYIKFLGAFFAVILAEGLVLALSGFLPEAVDAWVEASLYPSFSPTVLAFLGCSSLYGLWKSGNGGG